MLMKYLVMLIVASAEAKIRIYLTDTPLQIIGTRLYKKELLTDLYQAPKELTYDSSSRNLYFMYMDDALQNSGRAYINIITKRAMKIDGIEKNKAIAVDSETGEVYFGTTDGLYKYDPITNEATNIGLYNVNIMKLVVRNNQMYLLDANNHMIYKVYDHGKATIRMRNGKTVVEFDVDERGNVHYVTLCGLYCAIENGEVIKNKDLDIVNNFIVHEEKTFAVTEEGLYDIDCENGTATRVARLDFAPRSMTFGDYGDIFYSLDDAIYRLRPIVSYQVYNLYGRS
ncbi:uncharacterized protein LOC114249163 [Bombyx mandarina]|uniref:Uncharacterized protein LOC114249163 n=1 Tax=Bombyx mandarina TaxID=7092 RepID=A0A6J2K8Z7_BOMMA|nr:uncharacterized protein LOC114249163 [Bombyx mandarina]